jgi:hypothetical protein
VVPVLVGPQAAPEQTGPTVTREFRVVALDPNKSEWAADHRRAPPRRKSGR